MHPLLFLIKILDKTTTIEVLFKRGENLSLSWVE